MIRDLYENLVAPGMRSYRENWDNLSGDSCYLNPDPEAHDRASEHAKAHEKKEGSQTEAEKEAWQSPEKCARVCETEFSEEDMRDESRKIKRKCFQWSWNDGVCCTSGSFKLGEPRDQNDDPNKRWTSGWYLKGISDWIDAKGNCTEIAWRKPEP